MLLRARVRLRHPEARAMRWRLRSVRTSILLLVLVPVLSLIGIYVFAIGSTARDAVNLSGANAVKNAVGDPIAAFMTQLSTERLLAVVYMSAPSGANLAKLNLQETKTNAATAAMRATLTSGSTVSDASPAEKQAIAGFLRGIASLPSVRSQVSAQIIPSSRAFNDYNAIVQQSNRVLSAAIRQQNSAQLVAQALAFVRMGQSSDMLAQENTLLTAGQTSRQFTPADLQAFTQLVGARRAFYNLTLPDLDPQYRAYYTRAVSPREYLSLLSLENTVVGTRPGAVPPVSPLAWQQAAGEIGTGLMTAGLQAAGAITSQANSQATGAYLRLILAGGLGLVAIAISIALGLWIGRRLVRELSSLRETALELANERLPDVVSRLAAGEEVDASAQAPPITATSDEVRQVGEAFATVQQTAVEAAVGQAKLRQGISHIFRNLARRSQSLLHRQLTLLDAMERRASDPQELDDLFRVDHLATRMRRHAESLIILSGEAPARGWRHPVPLVDVLRAAVAEVEDYTRIKVTATTDASLAGPAVGDVIHMIAELAENATIYSPPQTPVSITGSVVGQGFAEGDPDVLPLGELAGVRPSRQRPARPVRRRPARQAAEHPDLPPLLGVRRDHGHRADPAFAGRPPRAGDQGRRVPAGRDQPAGQDGQARHLQRARAHQPGRRAARPGREPASPARSARPAHPGGGHRPARGVGTGPGLAGDRSGQLRREQRLPVRRHRLPARHYGLPARHYGLPVRQHRLWTAGVPRRGNHRPPDRVHAPAPGGGQRARQRHPGNGRRE